MNGFSNLVNPTFNGNNFGYVGTWNQTTVNIAAPPSECEGAL